MANNLWVFLGGGPHFENSNSYQVLNLCIPRGWLVVVVNNSEDWEEIYVSVARGF
jgi:hypothetical protein